MDRLERYCKEHGWELFVFLGKLYAGKEYTPKHIRNIYREFEISMNLDEFIEEMKWSDKFPPVPNFQGNFPFMASYDLI